MEHSEKHHIIPNTFDPHAVLHGDHASAESAILIVLYPCVCRQASQLCLQLLRSAWKLPAMGCHAHFGLPGENLSALAGQQTAWKLPRESHLPSTGSHVARALPRGACRPTACQRLSLYLSLMAHTGCSESSSENAAACMRSIWAAHCSTSCCPMPSSFCAQQTLAHTLPTDACNHSTQLIRH